MHRLRTSGMVDNDEKKHELLYIVGTACIAG